jgi:hypothetical protein
MTLFSKLTDKENDALYQVAQAIGTKPDWLYRLIDFESAWNPSAKNPFSSARGLIQFIDSTARSLGYTSADHLVQSNPDIYSQLMNPVFKYLSQFAPLSTEQSLTMSVFYPAYRSVPVDTLFPDSVRAVNPGINTVADYIKKVFGKDWIAPAAILVLAVAGLLTIYIFQRG